MPDPAQSRFYFLEIAAETSATKSGTVALRIRRSWRKLRPRSVIGAAVLFRYDVLNMMDQFAMFLAQPAIFATLASPQTDEAPRWRIYLLLNVRLEILPGFEFEDRDEIRCVDQRLIF